jgi:hypothetical protein
LTVELLETREVPSTLYVSTFGDNGIERINPAGDVRPFVTSGLSGPVAIRFGPHHDLFVANFGSPFGSGSTISRITPSGEVSTFASGLAPPLGLAFDSQGVLYASSPLANTIVKIAPDGTVTSFVSSGLAGPLGLAFDNNGNLYTPNFFAGTVSKITPAGVVSTFATGFTQPTDVIFDGNSTLYVDSSSSTINKVSLSGVVSPFVSAGLSTPVGMALDHDGTLFVANETNGTISEVTPDGVVSTFVSGLSVPQDLAFNPDDGGSQGASASLHQAPSVAITAVAPTSAVLRAPVVDNTLWLDLYLATWDTANHRRGS